MLSFTKILLIATFVAVVSSKPAKSSGQQKPIVFGEDVEGAFQLSISETIASYDEKKPEITLDFLHPYKFPTFKIPIITKIVVYVSQIDDDATFDVNIVRGGVGEDHVFLEVVAKNSKALDAKVKFYGVNEIECSNCQSD